jgi:uncharacterized protein (TIGR00369 family)
MSNKPDAGTRKDTRAARMRSARGIFGVGLPRALGVRLRSLTPHRVVGDMRVKRAHLNRNGRVGGGVLMAFADVMGAAGAAANKPVGFRGGTLESKTNFFAAAAGPVLVAESVPLHIGRTTSVWQTTIRNKGGRIVAIVTQTQMSLPPSLRSNGADSE